MENGKGNVSIVLCYMIIRFYLGTRSTCSGIMTMYCAEKVVYCVVLFRSNADFQLFSKAHNPDTKSEVTI